MAQQKQDELSIVKEIPNTFAPQLPPDKEPRQRATEKMNQFSTIILKKNAADGYAGSRAQS